MIKHLTVGDSFKMFGFSLVLLAVLLSRISAWSYDLEQGDCTYLGEPNFTQGVDLKYHFLRWREAKVEYETTRKIKCVKAKNVWTNGHGGYAEISEGGYQHTFVILNMKSQFSRGMHFNVEVYDYPENVVTNVTVQN